MKPRLLNRSNDQRQAFSIKRNRFPNFLRVRHYHPELELVYITESTGTRFVGDNIEKFEPGELVLLGKNLPHMWLNDKAYFQSDSDLMADALCIHFKEDFMGKQFLELAEAELLTELFKNARSGIRFIDLHFSATKIMQELTKEKDEFQRLLLLLKLLNNLAKHKNIKLLSSEGYLERKPEEHSDKTHEFIFKNFTKQIPLSEVAAIARMNPSAFSRYFKRIHRKTFSRYLIEIRIGYACKLLIENKINISSACYESGFNNISNFNKQFRIIMNMSPSQYIKQHQKLEEKYETT
jgi:AraC-like DNA-binding protein